ncbi:MAG: hypothetical protein KJ674_02550 [Nanoarchaeota archaeon]|nr:hypothetical protein [Nanoarchaeota archaeon]
MSDLKNKFLSVKEYNSIKEYKEEKLNEEIIEILNFTKEEAYYLEKKGFFYMPNKIIYLRKTENTQNIIQKLSKNKRNKLKKYFKNIKDLEIIKENTINKETFREWYYLYKENINFKKLGLTLIDQDWIIKNKNTSGIFLKKQGELIGGIICKNCKEDNYLPKRMSISWSALKEGFRNLGLHDCLIILMIDFSYELNYNYISLGKDTNIYGKHLSPGIPLFKTSLGYEIFPYKKHQNILIKFNNLDNFDNLIFFLSYLKDQDELIANLILKEKTQNIDYYNKTFLKKLRVFKYENKEIIHHY